MIEVKRIELTPYVFFIKYYNDKTNVNDITDADAEGLIEVIYEPIPAVSQIEVDKAFDVKEEKLIDAVNLITLLHMRFYDNFLVFPALLKPKYTFGHQEATFGKVISASRFIYTRKKE